ncbi:MAG: adenine deaminase C-terminal domain-containing protein [Acidilobus sp.]
MTVVRDPRPSPDELVAAANAALGREPLDLLIRGAEVVDVWSRVARRADVGVRGRVIACVGDCRSRALRVIGAEGLYLAPGFIDAHTHLESTFLHPLEFSRLLVSHGTTAAFVDVHEVGNVMGLRGVYAVAQAFELTRLKVFLLAPPNVPPSRRVDDVGGAEISYEEALQAGRALSGIGEVMDLQSVLEGDQELMRFTAESSTSMIAQGHMAGLTGAELDAYVSLGLRNDHEVTSPEELMERLSRGVIPLVRHGSSWRDLDRLAKLVSAYSPLIPIVTDDVHALHLVREGHLDRAVRRAVELGVDPVDALRAVTLAPATAFGLQAWLGSVSPGRFADLVLLDSLGPRMRVLRTLIDGSEATCGPRGPPQGLIGNTVDVSFTPSLRLLAPFDDGWATARVIDLVPDSPLTSESREDVMVRDGVIQLKGGLSEVHVINRYGRKWEGSGLLGIEVRGALASSVSHDTHNILVVGNERDSMAAALLAVASAGGGVSMALRGEVKSFLPLPMGGLMSDLPAEEVAHRLESVTGLLSRACSCDGEALLNQLQILTLTVIPELRVTDRGLYSVTRRSYVSLLEVR